MGDVAEMGDQTRRGKATLHMPEPEHEPLPRRTHDQSGQRHALLRMVIQTQDGNVLPTHPPKSQSGAGHP